ncbi:MAG: hypothetical protein K2Q18_16325, partial [Bdellovibrionales bacterium]|nr:hypothetical protein [Bdellovibrionales bacterium]
MSKAPPKKQYYSEDGRPQRRGGRPNGRDERKERTPKVRSDVKDTPKPKVNPDGTKEFDQSTFFASCPREVEHLLEKEIRGLGITRIEVEKGGVAFKCEIEEALDVLLNSRIASRVFKELQVYTIESEKDLYARAKEKWWDKVFSVHQTFKINTLFDRETKENFNNSMIFSQLLKDAIADQFREKFGERPSVDTGRPDITFLLRVERKPGTNLYNARILADMCGEPLSNRGYREESLKAPLRENLAAAIIMTTDFDPSKDIFTDTMCGTGTFLVEGILIRAQVAPTYLKIRKYIEKKMPVFDFLKHPWFQADRKAQRIFDEKAQAIYNHSLSALNELQTRQFFGFD